jgi:hypothetical protein
MVGMAYRDHAYAPSRFGKRVDAGLQAQHRVRLGFGNGLAWAVLDCDLRSCREGKPALMYVLDQSTEAINMVTPSLSL